jgi:hypothetical protein
VLFESYDHLMDRRRRDSEVCLHICFGRRTAINLCVVVDEGKVLTLFWSETRHLLGLDSYDRISHCRAWHWPLTFGAVETH